jgi:hypothetical protein
MIYLIAIFLEQTIENRRKLYKFLIKFNWEIRVLAVQIFLVLMRDGIGWLGWVRVFLFWGSDLL